MAFRWKLRWIFLLAFIVYIGVTALVFDVHSKIALYIWPEPPQLEVGDPKFNEMERKYLFLVGSSDILGKTGVCEVNIRAKRARQIDLKTLPFNDRDIRGNDGPHLVGITENLLIVKSEQSFNEGRPGSCIGWSLFFYDTDQRKRINRLDVDPAIVRNLNKVYLVWDGKDGFFIQLNGYTSFMIHYNFKKNIISPVTQDPYVWLRDFHKTEHYLILEDYRRPNEKLKAIRLSWPGMAITGLNENDKAWYIGLSGDDQYLSYYTNRCRDFNLRNLKTGQERTIKNIHSHSWSLDSRLLMTLGEERDPVLKRQNETEAIDMISVVGPPDNISIYSPTEDWQLKILQLGPRHRSWLSYWPYAILPKDCPTAKFLINAQY